MGPKKKNKQQKQNQKKTKSAKFSFSTPPTLPSSYLPSVCPVVFFQAFSFPPTHKTHLTQAQAHIQPHVYVAYVAASIETTLGVACYLPSPLRVSISPNSSPPSSFGVL